MPIIMDWMQPDIFMWANGGQMQRQKSATEQLAAGEADDKVDKK